MFRTTPRGFLSLGPQNRGLPFPTRWWPLSSVNVFVNLREVERVLSCSIPHSSIHQAKLLDDLCDHKLVAIPNWGTTLQRKRRAKGARGRACEPNSKHRWELTSLNEVKNSPGRGEVTGLPMAPVDGLCLQNGAYLLNATKKVVKMRL
jgi:hypothetical protein